MRAGTKRIIRWTLVIILALGFGGISGIVVGYVRSAPSLENIHFNPDLTTYIYDRNGNVITPLYKQNRSWAPLSEIPLNMQHAIVAIEDQRFYEHHGIDIHGILRSAWSDIMPGGPLEGASTITQQLARWAFLSLDRTWSRKLKEILFAIQIERKYSKAEILDAYLNYINFGDGSLGVKVAAQHFFNKDIADLDLAQCALLAALPNNPSGYNPFDHPKEAIFHRNLVLEKMAQQGYVTDAQAKAAEAEPLDVVKPQSSPSNDAAYFVSYVIQQLKSMYSDQEIYTGGLKVYTTLDLNMQKEAVAALQKGLHANGLPTTTNGNGIPEPEDALVSLDVHTGGILAMVGGRGQDQFNRAVLSFRQPGSAFKPFVYTVALQQHYTPASVLVDEPVAYPLPDGTVWKPSNDDNQFAGPLTLRDALEASDNIVAIKLLDQVGINNVIDMASQMGINLVTQGPRNDKNLSLALGGLTKGVTPLQMADAYAVFANQGIKVEDHAIEKIVDADGNVIYQAHPAKRVVLSEQIAYLITDMMRGVIERGTGIHANIGRPAAGKTGTGEDYNNAWFVGFTPNIVTSVWLGNDDQNKPMTYPGYGNVGSSQASQIWGDYMQQVTAGKPVENFVRPSGLVSGIPIDIKTGLLAPDGCNIPASEIRSEIFLAGTQPATDSSRCTTQPQGGFSLFGFSW